jgi:predicted PurR-regulated permease PerM
LAPSLHRPPVQGGGSTPVETEVEPAPPARAHHRIRRGPEAVRSRATDGLFILACLYTVAIAQPVLQPLAIAFLLYFLLTPVVRALGRLRVPSMVGAGLVLGGFLTVVGFGHYSLSKPAAHWMAAAPQSIREVQARARKIAARFEKVTQTAHQVEQMTNVTGDQTPKVELKEPGLGRTVFGGVQAFLTDGIVIITLLFFLLASGDLFLRRLMALTRRRRDREKAFEIARELERQVSSYIVTTTAINTGFGVAVGLMVWAIGLPNPLLWGVIAGLTNFVPYLGGLTCMLLLGLASMLTFPDWERALLVPFCFFVLNSIEGYLVTPQLMGRRLTLNTPALFIGLLFWWWVWGTAGALLAVPLMATLKIVADRIDALAPLAEFLGDDDSPVPTAT